MIRHPLNVGAVRFHHMTESINTSHSVITSSTFQFTTSIITARGPYQLQGDRWHLLTNFFSNATSCEADLHSELLLQSSFYRHECFPHCFFYITRLPLSLTILF